MAQQFPTSAQIVYDTLVADATFMSLLGTYEFRAGGGEVPAISIVSSGQSLPALRNVTGLECVIQDSSDFTQFSYLSDEPADIRYTWKVFIIVWEPATGSDMTQAASRAALHFGNCDSMETVATPDGLGSLVQTQIKVYSHMPILPIA